MLCSDFFFKLLFVLKRKPKKMRKRFFQYYKRLKLDRYHAKIQSVFILSRWLILCYDYLIQLKKISMKFVFFLLHFFITAHFHLYTEIKKISHRIFSHLNLNQWFSTHPVLRLNLFSIIETTDWTLRLRVESNVPFLN